MTSFMGSLKLLVNQYDFSASSDSGMTWQFGVRRSTRIRSRPLQHWRGERFLYGRIHDSEYSNAVLSV